MRKKIKWIIITILSLFVLVVGLVIFGFRLMAIEDTYGDLQEIYFSSKSGDIIVCPQTKKTGIIKKTFATISVINEQNEKKGLFGWSYYVNNDPSVLLVYRNKTNKQLPLQYDSVMKFIDAGKLKLVKEYQKK